MHPPFVARLSVQLVLSVISLFLVCFGKWTVMQKWPCKAGFIKCTAAPNLSRDKIVAEGSADRHYINTIFLCPEKYGGELVTSSLIKILLVSNPTFEHQNINFAKNELISSTVLC